MSFGYIHISDIHFGQERGGTIFVHNDAKQRLLEDVERVVATLPSKRAAGVLLTGDIAYAGKKHEYKDAAIWLDRLAASAGCKITDIQVVPGNHDIDRGEICNGGNWMLTQIAKNGEDALDTFLENDLDRLMLYARFSSYIPFAEGYNCPLDRHGGFASERIIELAPGRFLQFIGFNSALVCNRKDRKGDLLLGARQRVLPVTDGRELVVLCHHPLDWLQDSNDARRFVRNRARVFLSGHEHTPRVRTETIEKGCDLLTLEAGATVPPKAQDPFTYTYNVIEFAWDKTEDRLRVTVHPRAWDDDKKRFSEDPVRLGGRQPTFLLGCPQFRKAAIVASEKEDGALLDESESPAAAAQQPPGDGAYGEQTVSVPKEYPMTLLRFFRDLSDAQRLAVLVKLNALPADWSEASSHALERHILDSLVVAGRLSEINDAIAEQQRR